MQTMTSREFNQDTGVAKRAAMLGPVVITDRGTPAHVLLTFEAYSALVGQKSIVEALACPDAEDISFDIPKLQSEIFRPVEFD